MTKNDMNANNRERMEQLLKQSLPPAGDLPRATLQRDLWTAMRQRLNERTFAVPSVDWVLVAAVILWLALFPGTIPVLLYHL